MQLQVGVLYLCRGGFYRCIHRIQNGRAWYNGGHQPKHVAKVAEHCSCTLRSAHVSWFEARVVKQIPWPK